jgi:hypothetical protein
MVFKCNLLFPARTWCSQSWTSCSCWRRETLFDG